MTTFFVPGIPAPKGSTRSFLHSRSKRIITRASNAEKLEPWEARIALAAKQAGARLCVGACHVSLRFAMPRPKSHSGARGLKPSSPRYHQQKPDIDKLTRAVLDALTGVVWVDDCQVTRVDAAKFWADEGDAPGVGIEIVTGAESGGAKKGAG